MALKNVSVVPRIGNRASVKITQKNQCTGAERPHRKSHASFFGTLDLGEENG